MIAILAILAMFAFVVLPNLGQGLGGPSAPENPVVVEWEYGDIRRFELSRMVRSRYVVQAFLAEAYQHGFMASQELPPVVPVINTQTPVSEQNSVQTLVLAKEAEEMGFVVSDESINHYLKQLTSNSVDAQELNAIVARRQLDGRAVTMNLIFEVLRTELLARQLLTSYVNAAQGVTPAERWESWRRWNDIATIESVPVTVESFLDKIETPTESELATFFELYKNNVKQPQNIGGVLLETPLPGFRVLPKVAYHYVKADFDDFVGRIAEEIEDDQISKYYEDNKDREFVRTTLFAEPEAEEETDDVSDDETEDASATEQADETDAGDGQAEDSGAAESGEEDAAEGDATEDDASETADGDAESDETNSEGDNSEDDAETPEETMPEEEGAEPSTPSADNGAATSGQSGRVRLTLASFQQTTEEAETEEVETEEAAAQSADTENIATEDAASDEQDPASEGDASEPAADAPETVLIEVAEESLSEGAATEDEVEYSPLEEVEDQIRNTLATQFAAARMESVLDDLGPVLRAYADELAAWELNQAELVEGAAAEPRPELPDMRAAAEQNDLEFGETELLTYFEFIDTELGGSVGATDNQNLSTKAFSPSRTEYRPAITKDIAGNHRFLAWIVETTPVKDVTLEEVRADVERAWKMEKARPLALEEAQRLADQATESGQSLGEVFGADDERPVTESDPFSWLTIGATPFTRNFQLRLNEVVGVDDAGPAFMQAVFNLGVGDVGVAVNHPDTVAYVVRVVSHASTVRELQDTFLLSSASEVNQVRQANFQYIATSLLNELEIAHHLHWVGTLSGTDQSETDHSVPGHVH